MSTKEQEKNLAAVLYILNNIEHATFHKVFKMLYFADKMHLSDYGRTITTDKYIAMKAGPVPSKIYDNVKALRNFVASIFSGSISVSGHRMSPLAEPNLDFLSPSDMECLDYVIKNCSDWDWSKRVDESHDSAYHKTKPNREMNSIDIAIAGGANEEMINYINWLNENSLS